MYTTVTRNTRRPDDLSIVSVRDSASRSARRPRACRASPLRIESIHGGLHSDPRRTARQSGTRLRPVKQEIRDNLVRKLQAGETLFPGIIGYDETVIPQLVNAILSRHNFILLGLRGQAKSRILRGLVDLLDEQIPVVPGCEIHDDPLAPLCARVPRARRAAKATRCRSPGCRARRATSRSWRRPT